MVDRVDIPPTNTDAPEGHDTKMAELGAAAVTGLIPDDTADEPSTDTKIPETPTEADAPSEAETTPDVAEEALAGVGLDLSTYEAEFSDTGVLSADSYTQLEKAGIPKSVVDQYIEGQKAVAANATTEAHGLVGGADNYKAMLSWATTSLDAADKTAFNAAVDKGGASSKLAIAGLNAQFRAAQGSAPQLLGGFAPSGAQEVSGYRSTSELTTAMSDPRYAKDAAYRKDVETKLAASKLF